MQRLLLDVLSGTIYERGSIEVNLSNNSDSDMVEIHTVGIYGGFLNFLRSRSSSSSSSSSLVSSSGVIHLKLFVFFSFVCHPAGWIY